jgi:hypothetical protein
MLYLSVLYLSVHFEIARVVHGRGGRDVRRAAALVMRADGKRISREADRGPKLVALIGVSCGAPFPAGSGVGCAADARR